MKEALEEHRSTPIRFSMVEDRSNRPPKRDRRGIHNSFDVESTHFSLPTVILSSNKNRQRNQNDRRCCTMACFLRLFILIFPLVFYKEFVAILSLVQPQTEVSAPHIRGDYTNIKSVHDLSSELVRPWCFRNVIDCPCQDPMIPSKGDAGDWEKVYNLNKELLKSDKAKNVDVVFFGDSITEGWRGTHFGKETSKTQGIRPVFDSLFSSVLGGKFDGIALGIAADTSPNLLWRVQNGELPVNLSPSVFWVLIGTNDIGNTWCAPENVVVGILRVVEEILSKKPLAQVVLNALLPRSFNQEGYVAKGGKLKPSVWEDIKAINEELKMYATYRDRVVFFETNVFLKDPKAPKAELQIDEKLMPDFLHPSAKGYQLWGEEIAQKLEEIIPRKM